MDNDSGYTGASLGFLESIGAHVGDTIESESISGRLMPLYKGVQDKIIVLKLANSYNVAVSLGRLQGATARSTPLEQNSNRPQTSSTGHADSSLPKILLISTGGTIASRIDYVSGAVTPMLDAAHLIESIPELGGIADIDSQVVLSVHSENIEPRHWMEIARAVHGAADKYAGVLIAHGTDTMQYTASYLSFALAGFPQPIVLVGSQRSSDRPSSDAAENLCGAARFVASGLCSNGVYVVMHAGSSDGKISCHRGTRVRKYHTSERGAFETVGGRPAFSIIDDVIQQNDNRPYFQSAQYEPKITLDEHAALLKYHPGMTESVIDSLVERQCRAIILEGTGLGHVGESVYGAISRAIQKGVIVAMSSQCVAGTVNMNVYESGRNLLSMGVIPLQDMLAETALVKTMWALSQSDDSARLKEIILQTVASEASL